MGTRFDVKWLLDNSRMSRSQVATLLGINLRTLTRRESGEAKMYEYHWTDLLSALGRTMEDIPANPEKFYPEIAAREAEAQKRAERIQKSQAPVAPPPTGTEPPLCLRDWTVNRMIPYEIKYIPAHYKEYATRPASRIEGFWYVLDAYRNVLLADSEEAARLLATRARRKDTALNDLYNSTQAEEGDCDLI